MVKLPRPLLISAILIPPLASALALVSSGFTSVHGWLSFVAVLYLGLLEIMLIWHLIAAEHPPEWLLSLVLLAAASRLFLGVFWYLSLPVWGYDTEVQRAGYIMEDALHRDDVSWELSQSGKPLYYAFQYYSHTDQYGGLLFHNAAIFRYLGPDVHYPLLTVVVSAAFSSLAIALVWAASKRMWTTYAAGISAWFLALYPEAMLLGSSQMREAFTVTLAVAAIYLFQRYWAKRNWLWFFVFLMPVLISLAFSPGFSIFLLFTLALLASAYSNWGWLKRYNPWLLAGLAFVGLVGLLAVLVLNIDWLFDTEYQNYMTTLASGKVQAIFERIPGWLHVPFLVCYGVFRPLLPAALAASGNTLWQVIAIWRALGWTTLLFLLLYATFLIFRRKPRFDVPFILLAVNWLFVLSASYRGGGDMWDNPRYRVSFAALQVMLAAWALMQQRHTKDPWLRRTIGVTTSMIFWFMLWYIDRKIVNFGFPVIWIPDLIMLALFTGGLFVLWDWWRGRS